MARISREGTRHQKNFSLKEFKTWEGAEAKAAIWLKEKFASLPGPKERKGRLLSTNTSGVPNVQLRLNKRVMINGTELLYPRWTALWPTCPHKGGLSLKIVYNNNESAAFHKLEKDAFVMAVLAIELKDISRDRLAKKLEEIRGTKKEAEILARRNEQGIEDRFWELGIDDY